MIGSRGPYADQRTDPLIFMAECSVGSLDRVGGGGPLCPNFGGYVSHECSFPLISFWPPVYEQRYAMPSTINFLPLSKTTIHWSKLNSV